MFSKETVCQFVAFLAFTISLISSSGSHAATTDTVVRTDTQNANVGERVEMECFVQGTPLPTVTWSRLDGSLPATSSVNGVFLVIPSVQPEDAGTYVCTVENRVGSVKRVNLSVKV